MLICLFQTGRSVLMSHINATISGLSTIRATNSEDMLIREFNSLQDRNTSACYIFKASTRAIAFWMEWICVIYMAVAVTIFLFFDLSKWYRTVNIFNAINEQKNRFWTKWNHMFFIVGVSSGNVGLAITQILSLISLSQWGVRLSAEVENNMTSVERIMEYVDLEPEEKPVEKSIESLNKWPTSGSIEFTNVSLKYAEKGATMLKSLSVKINSGEKIGICGRTGAGKSSIISAIFRMACTVGVIKIDSVDISTIPLDVLRRNISIIPQDAILFSGTVRDNLDPFNEYNDESLWTALEQVNSKSQRKSSLKKKPEK